MISRKKSQKNLLKKSDKKKGYYCLGGAENCLTSKNRCNAPDIPLLADLDINMMPDINFSSTVTAKMREALARLIKYLHYKYDIEYLGGHNEFHAALNPDEVLEGDDRECPGKEGRELVQIMRKTLKLKSPVQQPVLQ